MSKYINADELKENINEELADLLYYFSSQNKDGLINRGVDIALKVINDSPESIVRCKDCEFWNTERPAGLKGYCYCEVYKGYKEAEGFCDCGEEREAEGEESESE